MKYVANKMAKPNHTKHRILTTYFFCSSHSFIKGECDINDEHEGTDMLLLALKIISLPVPVLKNISLDSFLS